MPEFNIIIISSKHGQQKSIIMAIISTINEVKIKDLYKLGNNELFKLMKAGRYRRRPLVLSDSCIISFDPPEETYLSWEMYKGQPILSISAKLDNMNEYIPIYLLRRFPHDPVDADALHAFGEKYKIYTELAWKRGLGDIDFISNFLGKSYDVISEEFDGYNQHGLIMKFNVIALIEHCFD